MLTAGPECENGSCALQIDLSTQPGKRGDMLAGSDHNTRLPQLHVNGQVCQEPPALDSSTHRLKERGRCCFCAKMNKGAVGTHACSNTVATMVMSRESRDTLTHACRYVYMYVCMQAIAPITPIGSWFMKSTVYAAGVCCSSLETLMWFRSWKTLASWMQHSQAS